MDVVDGADKVLKRARSFLGGGEKTDPSPMRDDQVSMRDMFGEDDSTDDDSWYSEGDSPEQPINIDPERSRQFWEAFLRAKREQQEQEAQRKAAAARAAHQRDAENELARRRADELQREQWREMQQRREAERARRHAENSEPGLFNDAMQSMRGDDLERMLANDFASRVGARAAA